MDCPVCFEEVDSDGTCPNTRFLTRELRKCLHQDMISFRTPNQFFFIAACQNCGKVVSSISDGGSALKLLFEAHRTTTQEIKP